MDTENKEALIPLARVQEILDIDYETAKKMKALGQITPVRVGSRDRFRLSEIQAILHGEDLS